MTRATGGGRTTLHNLAGPVPDVGDVMVRVHGPGPQEGERTRAAPMLVLSVRPITRGTCTRCESCTRWSVEFARVDEIPTDADVYPTTRLPPNTPTV